MSQSFTRLAAPASFLCPCPRATSTDSFYYSLFSTSSWPLFSAWSWFIEDFTCCCSQELRGLKVSVKENTYIVNVTNVQVVFFMSVGVWIRKETSKKKACQKKYGEVVRRRGRRDVCSESLAAVWPCAVWRKAAGAWAASLRGAAFYFSVVSVERSNCCAFLTALRLSVWEFSLIIVVRWWK